MSDILWQRLELHFPGKVSAAGVTAKDNRMFLDAVFWQVRHRFGHFLRSQVSPAARHAMKTKSVLAASQVGTVGNVGTFMISRSPGMLVRLFRPLRLTFVAIYAGLIPLLYTGHWCSVQRRFALSLKQKSQKIFDFALVVQKPSALPRYYCGNYCHSFRIQQF
ncbi:MAG: hypothetical protein ACSHXW_19580 [Yoonia sp.]